ncbi:MAG TPA: threonine/serine dehydratase [Ilumatobacter sp.]|jgi:threonine dehydratase|nr:threonine/serine dehydratase [Ilumatobacter sp.]
MSTADIPVTPDDVERAAERIGGRVRRTPVIEHGDATLKLELLQHAGSFKPRGAFNRVLTEPSLPAAGLLAASGGNHGAALAFVGQQLGLRVEIFVPSTSPAIKRANIERFGADVTVIDGYYDDAQREVEQRQAQTGALMVHPYDHAETIAGQGTMAKELEEQLGEFDTLVVANGGGGFVAGQAAWFRNRVKIVSVEPELSQCLRPALQAGERVPVTVGGIAADSLGAQLGEIAWAISRHFVDEAVLVSDDDIRAAQKQLWNDLRLVVEPGGAAAYAALMTGTVKLRAGERVVVVLCGSNCDPVSVV